MCGICGFSGLRNDDLLKGMASRLAHRGPDEDGFFTEGEKVSLGMRRLKIIDLATGGQPISSEDGTVTVVFNGEIYNFKELRAGLEAKGHRFRTRTDTEVLVHLYEEYGADLASRLRGMFAFALWDSKRAALLLARDQFGIKPLFYSLKGDKLYFASEMKALLLAGEIGAELDTEAVDAYFTNLYIPAPLTAYKAIRKLEPAQTLFFRGGKAEINTYWRVPEFGASPAKTWEEYLEVADGLLAASVKEQLVADVPLGLLLSGGVDSSSLLYYMNRAGAAPVKTFSVGYGRKDASFNETAQSRVISEFFRSDHAESVMEPDPRIVMQKLAATFDEPFADASAIPTFLVTGEARKKVTVALTGVGGDEFFGGYPRHLGARLMPAYLKLPAPLREGFWAAARLFNESYSAQNLPGRMKRFLKGGRGDFRGAYDSWLSYFTPEERAGLYAAPHASAAGSAPRLPGRLNSPDEIFAYELRNYLSDDLLCLSDRVSMANSLELRVPFLDVRLAELMASAPLALKTRGFSLKAMLKTIMADRLPAATLSGPKRGFQVPLARWYAEELKDFTREVLSGSSVEKNGWLAPGYIAGLLKEHESGRRNLNDQIHAVVMFELWLARNRKLSEGRVDSGIRLSSGPLNILVCTDIIPEDDAGGSGRVAWETAKRLAAMGHRPVVLTKGARNKKDFEIFEDIEVYRYRGSPFKLRARIKEILARHGSIDVLDLHHPYTAVLALGALKGVPAVYNFHSPWAEEYSIRARDLGINPVRRLICAGLRKFTERRVLRSSRVILNASGFMAERLRAVHGLDSRLIPLGVDLDKFRPARDPAPLRERLRIPPKAFMVFTVRNLASRMGLENLVEAAAAVVKERPDAFFVIGGSGYLRGKLEAMIKSAGLGGRVRLAGYIPEEDLAAYYQCADLFILPTRLLEGFGLVTLEALACGTPVLATPVGANPEVLKNLDPKMLLEDISPAGIAAGILRFIPGYLENREAMRGACRKFTEENYSWVKYAKGVERALFDAVSAERRS
ncbi:MAG: asparagine synthase (glutamine-hydrolyzing) [Elusimicrobia bacterium GWA2_61_42]|nr:MAG: asparagine synthase (glutamine-hydrolyzing) [Elusimicrobia bacterium GWA2_61_42]OGR78748.1 MAG: asparagine synthase (glutamine-hydrolyzing) [Elusimicrobia bacterium GWC2_61_25]